MNRSKFTQEMFNDVPELKKIYKILMKEMPYKFPKKYITWEHLAKLISFYLGLTTAKVIEEELANNNIGRAQAVHKYSLWAIQKAPIYCISNEVLEAMLNTQIKSEIIQNIHISLPTVMLLFPKNTIKHKNGFIDNAVIHAHDKNKPELSQGLGWDFKVPKVPHYQDEAFDINVTCTSIDTERNMLYTGYPVGQNVSADNKPEGIFYDLKQILLMFYVILQSNPEMVGSSKEIVKQKGFGTDHNIYPRILKVPPKKYCSNNNNDTRGSVRTHWRRAHYRIIQNNGNPKLVYVNSCIVNG
ncbi:MAG: hypothetical protein F6K24_01695 [Okeania sp. SIO2D1]|nr:hypothetical protein [Okeania sp. SIO2D1]